MERDSFDKPSVPGHGGIFLKVDLDLIISEDEIPRILTLVPTVYFPIHGPKHPNYSDESAPPS